MLFLVFGASGQAPDTDRDPCLTGTEKNVQIPDWLLTPRKIGSAEWLAEARRYIPMQVRKAYKAMVNHYKCIWQWQKPLWMIHSLALCSDSAPQGLEYNFLCMLLLYIFSSDLFSPHKEQWLCCSAQMPSYFVLFWWSVRRPRIHSPVSQIMMRVDM